MESTRNRDYLVEQFANEFEDTYFWPRQLGQQLSCMVRHQDKEHQFAGIDFSLTTSRGSLNFDSKVKYYKCLNRVCTNPGFEVSFRNGIGKIQDGWLVDDGKRTSYYELISLSCTVQDDRLLSSSTQISAMDILWVKKQELMEFIQQHTSIDTIKADAFKLRADGDNYESKEYMDWLNGLEMPMLSSRDPEGKYRKVYSHKKFHLTYSSRLKEQPVNLVISRSVLESLKSTRHFVVTHDFVKNAIRSVN